LLADVDATLAAAGALPELAAPLAAALADLRHSTATILANWQDNRPAALARAYDYMMQTGYVMGAWHLVRSALIAKQRLDEGSDNPFYERKLVTARFYCESVLPRAAGFAGAIAGGDALLDYAENWL
nr:acyl-CoA dehydrogenase C-terminal domain-containing protein [Halieaceae bacterium]